MRAALLLLPLLAVCIAHAAASPADDSLRLRVMSFNIRYANPGDGANRWEKRRDLAFETIRKYDPDILCLQEALKPQLDDILTAFPGYAHAGVGRDDGKSAGEYAAILYRRERFAAWSDSTFWLSDTPQLPGSKSWGNNVTRICSFVELTDQTTMKAVTVFNTHLDHESQPAREKGVELICAYLDRCKGPYILAGDFNMGRDNSAMQKLLAIRKWQKPPWPAGKKEPCWVVVDGPPRVIDSYRVVHGVGGIEGTYHAFTGRTEGERIDFIFIERLLPAWRFLSSDILRDNENGRYPSDHFPVTATIALHVPSRWRGQKH